MKIKNKIESAKLIKNLNLNRFDSLVVTEENKKDIVQFVLKHKTSKFAIRDNYSVMSKKYKNNLSAEDVLEFVEDLTAATLTVSGLTFKDNKVLSGEIQISRDLKVSLSATSKKELSARDGALAPQFLFFTDIFDSKLKKVQGFKEIVDYIFNHNLFDLIVEFTVFDRLVGVLKENVIVWEIRTDY